MTHAFLSSLARRFNTVAAASTLRFCCDCFHYFRSAARMPRRFAPRASAWLLACAALGCGASLPLAAQARVKATRPSVNVTTVLPQSVMVGLQRAHVPLVVDQRGRGESRRPHADRRAERRQADDARLDDETRHHLLGPVDPRPRLPLAHERLRGRHHRRQRRAARQSLHPGHGRSEARAGRTDRPRAEDPTRRASPASTARWCSTSATSIRRRATCRRSTTTSPRRTTSAPIRCCTRSNRCRSR